MRNINKYIKGLLSIITICSCYSVESNRDKEIEDYYGMTFQEFNKRLMWILNDMDFKIKHIINYINMQIDNIFTNKIPNNITKIFQNNLESEYNKLKVILNKINEQYNKILNTNNKLDITDLVLQYHESMFKIDKLFKEYIQQNNNSYYTKTISYLKYYLKNNDYNKESLQELLEFLQSMIVKGKFFYNLWMSFYVEYKKYYGKIFALNDWENI